MSAVAGVIRLDRAAVAAEQLEHMARAVDYIETDAIGRWLRGEAGLLHFKLATTPEAVAEQQPVEDTAADLVVMLDGRLDNRDELLRLLGPAGMLDRGAGDGAILLQLYRTFGRDTPSHLVGDYAFIVWEPRRRRLFCARSPLGWRPLLWYADATTFAFSTEPKALIEGLKLPRRLNEAALGEFLSMRFVSQTETLWQGIHRLPPGSAIQVDNGKISQWHWHHHISTETFACDDEEEAAERFLQLFDGGLLACLRSSTRIAAHLSGGLDSSSIVCRARQLLDSGRTDRELHPISVRFPGESHDEGEWITAVEAHAGVTTTTLVPGDYGWEEAMAWCAETLQLPLRPNVLGTGIGSLNFARAQGMRVLLTGEGGDDWLRGSRAHWPDLLANGHVRQLWREAVTYGPGPLPNRLVRMARESAGPLLLPGRRDQILYPHLQFSHLAPPWLRPGWATKIGLHERWQAVRAPVQLTSLAAQQRFARYTMARPHVNVDNVLTLAAQKGIELRHPFHDLRLTRYLMDIPGGLLLRGKERKYLLRCAMRGILPEKVRTRQSKGDLSKPYVDALENYLAQVPVHKLVCAEAGWVDPAEISRYFQINLAWYRGGCNGPVPREPLSPVWSVVAADVWLRSAMGI